MSWITKSLVVATIVAIQFSAISNAEQLVFTIQDGRLILPLASAAAVSSMDSNNIPGIFEYSAAVSSSQSTTKIIDIARDGHTCPEGSEAAATLDNTCSYGNYIGDRKISGNGKCCFISGQNVFLFSQAGGENNLKAKYTFDSRTCCTGEEPTALIGGRCEYGKAALKVPTDYLTRCCWNNEAHDFDVHVKQFQPTLVIKDAKIHVSGQAPNSFCNLGYKVDVGEIRVFGDRVELDVSVNIDCATYNHTDSTTLTIYLSHLYHASGRLTYVLSWVGPTVHVDLSSRINDDRSVDLHGRITGTGVLSRLEEGFTNKIDDAKVKETLAWFPLC